MESVYMQQPLLSIGLPVYNGEEYLEDALDSLLSQTFRDFELIICDNASTDGTERICQEYAKRDNRIQYYRNESNIGMHKNWNQVFELSAGKYFKWAAHDDIYAPQYIENCMNFLEQNASVVLCSTRTRIIDAHGKHLMDYGIQVDTSSSYPHERFYNMLAIDHWCFQIFGVIRSDVLKMTHLHAYYFGSDRALLAELCLLGRVCEIPDFLFFRRDHPKASARAASNRWERLVTYNPSGTSQTRFLGPRRIFEYAASIHRSPLRSFERSLCYWQLVRLIVKKSSNRLVKSARLLYSP